jgi:RNA polymerase Rpb4
MAQLANLTCESCEEAKLLIPSLDRIDDEELTLKLNELTNLRQYQ